MLRRKQSTKSRRDKNKRSDSSTSLTSLQQRLRNIPAASQEYWMNPHGKTVHWNSRSHRYTRRRRRCDSSIEADSLTTSSNHSLRNSSLKSRSHYSQKNSTFNEEDKHSLHSACAQRRLRNSSRHRRRKVSDLSVQ